MKIKEISGTKMKKKSKTELGLDRNIKLNNNI